MCVCYVCCAVQDLRYAEERLHDRERQLELATVERESSDLDNSTVQQSQQQLQNTALQSSGNGGSSDGRGYSNSSAPLGNSTNGIRSRGMSAQFDSKVGRIRSWSMHRCATVSCSIVCTSLQLLE
jgi:hypothetical protein